MEAAHSAWKRLYRFDEWSRPAAAAAAAKHAAADAWPLPQALADGATCQAELRLEAPGHARCTQAVWRLPAAHGGGLVRTDVHEAASARRAREMLLALLAQAQVPLERWQGAGAPGEVAFAAPHGGCVAFVRDNLVAMAVVLGPASRGLAGWAAQQLDAALTARGDAAPIAAIAAQRAADMPAPAVRQVTLRPQADPAAPGEEAAPDGR
ncbi:hypothetical protein V4F39_03170 [Aquincola sp. MAHUQ-54]|uniref:Uncharacterized protein n=1 Tax=Aquincola agrisoli TaxID=3119538 RepID=A0AAW9QBW3_9BURK